jgi:hypothetical protein
MAERETSFLDNSRYWSHAQKAALQQFQDLKHSLTDEYSFDPSTHLLTLRLRATSHGDIDNVTLEITQ